MNVLKRISVLAVLMLVFGVIGAMAQVNVTATAGTTGHLYNSQRGVHGN